MSKATSFQDRSASHSFERQMRNWEIGRTLDRSEPPKDEPRVKPFVTISRMLGSGGIDLARVLSKRLGWPLLDRELLLAMANGDEAAVRLYDSIDEHDRGWLEVVFAKLMDVELSKDDYFQRLKRVVVHVARERSSVFLGRGTDMILPRNVGLRVKLVADLETCARHYAMRKNMTLEQARRTVARVEHDRSSWIRHQFHHDPDDPQRHDLCFNTDRISIEEAAELIVALLCMKGMTSPHDVR